MRREWRKCSAKRRVGCHRSGGIGKEELFRNVSEKLLSDIEGPYMTVDHDGDWFAVDEDTWRVEGIVLRTYETSEYLKVNCNIRLDGNNYIIFNGNQTIVSDDYAESDDVDTDSTNQFEPSEERPFLTVSSALISEDRDGIAALEKMYLKEKRKKWIESQFSSWDKKHIALSELIKDNLNDSKSFKHIETSWIDVCNEEMKEDVNQILAACGFSERVEIGDLFIMEEFTAKNAFNATIKNTAYGIVHELVKEICKNNNLSNFFCRHLKHML